jgi:hypothetical protein
MRHVRAFEARVPSEVDKLRWPLERLHALRDARPRALLRVAKIRGTGRDNPFELAVGQLEYQAPIGDDLVPCR